MPKPKAKEPVVLDPSLFDDGPTPEETELAHWLHEQVRISCYDGGPYYWDTIKVENQQRYLKLARVLIAADSIPHIK